MANLPFKPTAKSTGSITFRVIKHKFGDGYEQRTQDGINSQGSTWSMNWILSDTDKQTLLDFFKGLGGVTPFDWTSPDSTVASKYIVSTLSYAAFEELRTSVPTFEVTAEVYEVYEP